MTREGREVLDGGAAAGDPGTLEVRSPRDGSRVGEVPVATERDVAEAVERSRRAQREWARIGAAERLPALEALVRTLGERAERIARVVRDETGKPEVEALAEVLVSVELLRHYSEIAPGFLRRAAVPTGWLVGKSAYSYREPYGVVGAVTPWNYPFLLPMDSVTAALVTGNSIVIKPSEHTPFSSLEIPDLCAAAGLPADLVQVVAGDGAVGEALVRAGVDKVVFTGSSATGRRVMAAASETLTPVALELGGKDPAIVLEDADLERAAHGVVYGSFFNAGQTCISTERVYVVEAVFDDFVERVKRLTERLAVGTEGEADVGPMSTAEQLAVVEGQVEDAIARGARVLVGGERIEPGSRCYRPTVLVDVDPSMRVLREETFGPLLPVVRVEDEDEAVRMANESPFGLFASVWTGDPTRGERVGERLRCGGVSVNDTLGHYAVPGLPVGGVGESGFGRRRGLAGLEEMTRSRAVLIHRVGLTRDLWWYPYSRRVRRLVEALLEYRRLPGWKGISGGIHRFLRSWRDES